MTTLATELVIEFSPRPSGSLSSFRPKHESVLVPYYGMASTSQLRLRLPLYLIEERTCEGSNHASNRRRNNSLKGSHLVALPCFWSGKHDQQVSMKLDLEESVGMSPNTNVLEESRDILSAGAVDGQLETETRMATSLYCKI